MKNKTVDLRSDTVTRPSAAMKEVMMKAPLGDDVLGDDPTVKLLEERIASLLGKEAAIYVASGTMANLLALISQTSPGDEIILERNCHIFNYEAASSAVIGGVQLHPLDSERGFLPVEEIPGAVRPDNIHHPRTSMICVENTHNRGGGGIYPFDEMKEVRRLAGEHGLRVHLDGARLPNAVVASGIPFDRWAALADSVNICFSKGLGAPVGSALVSDSKTIEKARYWRKRLGGGWRQAGILAAACLYALDNNVERMAEDHARAARIAELIEADSRFKLAFPAQTNIVIFEVDDQSVDPARLAGDLCDRGILCLAIGGRRIRMVTHLDVSSEDIEYFEKVFPAK